MERSIFEVHQKQGGLDVFMRNYVQVQPSIVYGNIFINAVEEVVDKVLSEPIRPHFAILCLTHKFKLGIAHEYVKEKLGFGIPVVTYESRGVMGKDALTDEFGEIQMPDVPEFDPETLLWNSSTKGILLTVGFVPGVKVDVLPLLHSQDTKEPLAEKFIQDIRAYTNSVSGCTSPAGIIMFGDMEVDMEPVIDKLDHAMDRETFIVGDEAGKFEYGAINDTEDYVHQHSLCSGVALLFMKDANKPRGIGEIEFHVVISPAMTPIGPTFRAVAVADTIDCSTKLRGTNGDPRQQINGGTMIRDIELQLGDTSEYPNLFIGVTKRRYLLDSEGPSWSTSMAFHDVIGGDLSFLHVHGRGIRTGDNFRFYHPNPISAASSCTKVSDDFENLQQDFDARGDKTQVFGGFVFAASGRGEPFFPETYGDSLPFLENFPDIPIGGTFSSGEFMRSSSSLYGEENEEAASIRCCRHHYSTVYLLMSYTPTQPES